MKKLFIVFSITLISLSLLNPFKVKADNNGCTTEIVTNNNTSLQYCMPSNIYNNGTEREKAQYRVMIRTGNVGKDDIDLFNKYVAVHSNERAALLEGDLKGYVSNYWQRLGLYFERFTTGQLSRQNLSAANYLLGAMFGHNGTSAYQAELNSLDTSTNRNYYTGTQTGTGSQNNVYNTGDTNYYSFYNPQTQQFYVNNNYYEINNYEYNFNYYYSTYYTVNNDITFNYVYNIDNSVVNIIENGITTTYTYYYKLPDGRNSYNLTEDDILGLKTDINVQNYSIIEQTSNLLGLYHLDQNKNNSVYKGNELFNIYPNTISYVDSQLNFNSALYIGSKKEDNPNIITLNVGNGNSVDFRLYLSDINDIAIDIDGNLNKSYFEKATVIHTQTTQTKNIITYQTQSSTQSNTAGSCGSGSLVGTTQFSNYKNGSNTVYVKTWACAFNITATTSIQDYENVRTYDGDLADKFRYNEWNHIAIHNNGSSNDIYINGVYIGEYSKESSNNVVLKLYGSGYCLLDEIRYTSGDIYNKSSYNPPSTPYDDNVIFVLPQNIQGGTLLIQSSINVNDFQIGGVRKTNPNKGDVFVLVNDVGLMQSLQQYDGSDWIECKGAIYNEALGLWVSYYGYSIYTNNWDYTSLEEFSVDDIENDKDFYQWLGAQLNKIIKAIESISFNNVVNNNSFFPESTNLWDFLIKLMEDLINGVGEIVDKLIEFLKWLLVPSEEIQVDLQDEMDLVKQNLGFIYTPIDLFNNGIQYLANESNFNNPQSLAYNQTISFNGFEYMNVMLIPPFTYSFNDLFNNSTFADMHRIYLNVIDVVCIFYVLNLARNKLERILK